MSDSNKLKTFNVKKNERHLAKKRKLEAFLDLVRKDEATPLPEKKKSETFEENYKALKDELRKYQKKSTSDPLFYLTDDGKCAQVSSKIKGSKSSLFVEDISHLLLMAVLGNVSPYPLQWAKLEHPQNVSKCVFIEIDGLSPMNILEVQSNLNGDGGMFPYAVEVVSSNIPFATELCTSHVSTNVLCQGNEYYSSMFPTIHGNQSEIPGTLPPKVFSRLHLLLSPIQLAMENYPLPRDVFEQSKSEGFCFSKDSYIPVHDDSPMFAVDCEMCRSVSGKHVVTSIAIVNECLETIYHTLVKPDEEIVDYLTRYSGITEKMLRNVTTTLADVQENLRKILPKDAILCGHSLNCDLKGLKMIHPYVIDTSVIFNEYGIRKRKPKLKHLAELYLKQSIQDGKKGHSPVEDSIATMKLVQLKLEKSVEFGDAVLSHTADDEISNGGGISSTFQQKRKLSNYVISDNKGFFSILSRFAKKICLVGSESSLANYCPEMVTSNVTQIIKSKTKKIFKVAAESVENHDLILSHVVSDTENCLHVELVDEVKQMYNSCPSKTLFVIFLSSVNKPPEENFKKNYCLISMKK